jgi:hypothetical protein
MPGRDRAIMTIEELVERMEELEKRITELESARTMTSPIPMRLRSTTRKRMKTKIAPSLIRDGQKGGTRN